MRLCNRNLTPFQRRHIGLIAAMLGLCSAFTAIFPRIERSHFSTLTYCVIALVGVLPIVGTMIALGRYLTGETDEYLRSLAVRSVLWGFGVVMVLDTFLGYVIENQRLHIPTLTALNLEIFLVTAAFALRIQLWRNR